MNSLQFRLERSGADRHDANIYQGHLLYLETQRYRRLWVCLHSNDTLFLAPRIPGECELDDIAEHIYTSHLQGDHADRRFVPVGSPQPLGCVGYDGPECDLHMELPPHLWGNALDHVQRATLALMRIPEGQERDNFRYMVTSHLECQRTTRLALARGPNDWSGRTDPAPRIGRICPHNGAPASANKYATLTNPPPVSATKAPPRTSL
jgi:hypothetical protein